MRTSFVLMLAFTCYYAFSNNLSITNLSKTSNTITFDLSWENSWRSGFTYHDAVWIFVKQAPNGGPSWEHANIFSAAVGTGFETQVPADEVGFFVRRSSNGNGTASTSVTVTLDGLIGAFQDVKVMGIEMVYVPNGAFYAGDGASGGRIARGDDVLESVHITSNSDLVCGSTSSNIQYASGTCTNIPSGFPLGFNDFYCMKYAITQSQYVDFLNCLGRNQQENRVAVDLTGISVTNVFVLCDNTSPVKGNVVRCDANIGTGNITFYCDRNNNGIPNEVDDGMSRACNYLNATDWMAYLDWSGLRPFSFLEVEKASRGPLLAVQNEQSWGSTLWTNNGSLQNAGTATEQWSNSGIDGGISTYSDDVIRVGCNAPSTGATRELSNASFYGIIDIGNNPSDFYISKDYVETFKANDGDGSLNSAGEANVNSWPLLDPNGQNKAKISSSSSGVSALNLSIIGRSPSGGGRGVRSNF